MNPVTLTLSDKLHLVALPISTTSKPVDVSSSVDHHLCVDCSGSMHDALRMVRQHLKNKLAMMVRPNDTITISHYSSRGDFGVLIERFAITDTSDLTQLHSAIDRFLVPRGLTGFVEPLQETRRAIERAAKQSKNLVSFHFLSDGYDNQWTRKQILDAVDDLAPLLASATFIEYGYYANRALMAEMAEHAGGSLIFCEDFPSYTPVLEGHFAKTLRSNKKIELSLPSQPAHDLVYALSTDDEVLTFAVRDQKVMVNEGIERVYFLSAAKHGHASLMETIMKEATSKSRVDNLTFETMTEVSLRALYAGLYLLVQRMKTDDALQVLKTIGDAALIKTFTNTFGKQAFSDFMLKTLACVKSTEGWFAEGYNPYLVPAEDAFTVLDVLETLTADENKVYPDDPSFGYQRIGRAAVAKDTVLNETEQTRLAGLASSVRTVSDLAELQKLVAEIEASKQGLKFAKLDENGGYPVSKLVGNETRPNISIMVQTPGYVDLPADRPAGVPARFMTSKINNYAIIRDGILNTKYLPVSLTRRTFHELQDQGLLLNATWSPGTIYTLDLRALPIINRKMVREVSAERFFRAQYMLAKAKAEQRALKYLQELHFPKAERVSAGFADLYGEDAARWLKDQGFGSGNVFNPKRELAESTDHYMARELLAELKGLKTVPTPAAVIKAIADKKTLTPAQSLMATVIRDYNEMIATGAYQRSSPAVRLTMLQGWLDNAVKEKIADVRAQMRIMAQIKFSVLVGQVWFKEFATMDDCTMNLTFDGVSVTCTANSRDVQIDF